MAPVQPSVVHIKVNWHSSIILHIIKCNLKMTITIPSVSQSLEVTKLCQVSIIIHDCYVMQFFCPIYKYIQKIPAECIIYSESGMAALILKTFLF